MQQPGWVGDAPQCWQHAASLERMWRLPRARPSWAALRRGRSLPTHLDGPVVQQGLQLLARLQVSSQHGAVGDHVVAAQWAGMGER